MRSETRLPADAELLARAINLVNRQQVGVMCTVTADGKPAARWMTSVADAGLRTLYTMTAADTRKVAELQAHPAVAWVFTAEGFGDVVTLRGTVKVHMSALAGMQAWDRLSRAVQTYAFGSLRSSEEPHIVTLETTVESLEILSPELEMYAPRTVPLPR